MIGTFRLWIWMFFLAFAPLLISGHEAFSEPVHIELLHEEDAIQSGRPFWVAVHLKIKDDWHAYWKNPGDTGMAPTIEWILPEGFTASPTIWPHPKKFISDSFIGFGYEEELILLSQITPPKSLPQGQSVQIAANVQWLVCSESECVPGETELNKIFSISAETPSVQKEWVDHFARARAQVPKPYTDLNWNVQAHHKNDLVELHLQLPQEMNITASNASFFPEQRNVIDHKVDVVVAQSTTADNVYILIFKDGGKKMTASSLKGILVISDAQNKPIHIIQIEAPFEQTVASAESEISLVEKGSDQDSHRHLSSANTIETVEAPLKRPGLPTPEFEGGLGMALLLAFIGGMILNLMPCVLPVMSFKILSFVKMAGQSRSLTLKHGLAFSAGVVVSFWILAAMLLILKAYGHTVGWGFQLQEPIFVAVLAAILFVLALSLFGLFETGAFLTSLAGQAQTASVKSEGMPASFFSGVLATAVATPCTGPFLGAAIGFAVTLSAPYALLVFTVLGLGMAFPYLILAAYPNLLKFLPKPGAWMITFKEIMGFVILATILWLVWVFGAQTSSIAMVILLFSFFWLAVGGWIYGKWGSPVHSYRSRVTSYVLVLSCIAIAGYAIISSTSFLDDTTNSLIVGGEVSEGRPQTQNSPHVWEKFSPERIAELQERGVPVLVDFTAKWCLICQANHLVLSNGKVEQRLAELGVVKMKADWTKNDEMITQELHKLGRSGVPVYLLYTGESSEFPHILPQVLTPDIVLDYLDKL